MLIVKYQPIWASNFEQIKASLLEVLNSDKIRIEHVGSTSIPQLAAKPIIDVDVIYDDMSSFNEIRKNLESLRYEHAGDQGIAGREVFTRNHPNQRHPVLDAILHHLYVCHHESAELLRHLTFRDFLRENEDARKTYEQMKYEIAKKANQDKKKYAQLKEKLASDYIESVLTRKDL